MAYLITAIVMTLSVLEGRRSFPYCISFLSACVRASARASNILVSMSLCVCPRSKGKTARAINSKLGTHIANSMAVARQALTRRSKGQRSASHVYENRYGHMTAIVALAVVLPLTAWDCTSYDCLGFWLYYNM